MNMESVNGSFTSAGTLAAVTVTIGYKPSGVRVWTTDKMVDYTSDMDAGKGFCTTQETDDVTFAELSANGITLTDTGFIVGTACQKASAKAYWQAVR